MGFNSSYIRFWAGLAISLSFNSISQSAFIPFIDGAKAAQQVTVKDISTLDNAKVVKDINAASDSEKGKVLLMFDIDGTLKSHLDKYKEKINPWVHDLLGSLSQDPRFAVYLNTGRSDESLRASYKGDEFKQMGWYAEHGTLFSAPGDSKATDLRDRTQRQWLGSTMELIEVSKSDGKELWPGKASRDQAKQATISFTTRHPNKEFDQFFEDLKEKLKETSVVTQHKETKTLIEVTPIGINKGTAVDHLMRQKQYDLALAAGDDERDFTMHERIRQNMMEAKKKAYSIIITQDSEKPTAANYKLGHFHDFVRDLLAELSPGYKNSYPLRKSPSMPWTQSVKLKNENDEIHQVIR
ncbi:uncharacterized protein MELLADRAFT_124415 [Melampsora larici-populina 98AG31]|uniref:Trehalose-phosphatase n=1 Tax=Melampsora larici-populina (strain 98AG31 / pathotype 3-4-7) TaxID=747676 RepID=F4S2M8_MELLP|nr:uncharacterized protein MELLADRAFT_124415 [Melampsora larici-populina 98AG31]EGG01029.1 hypothetical protein MELLADRAFT_124415 [Melampsora larici-populina 98AG31]